MIVDVVNKMRELRKELTPQQKLGWYHRHWPSMGLDPTVDKTFGMQPWDEQCQTDWRVNG